MARFRAETVYHQKTNRYFVEIYYPDDAATPFLATDPIYPSHEVAEASILEHMAKAFKRPVKKTGK
jgi:hypothetical protein